MSDERKLRVRVYHSMYGCDTGCCGHVVEVDGREEFDFAHPDDRSDMAGWARKHAEDVIRKKWPECLDSIDWSTLDVSEVGYW